MFYLFGYETKRRNKQFKKAQFCENIATKWTGFIRRRTGFIRWRMKPVCQRTKPVLLALFFFSVLPSKSLLKPLFLRTYVDLLNYPFKQHCKLFAGPPFTLTIYMNIQYCAFYRGKTLYIQDMCIPSLCHPSPGPFLYKLHVETILFCGLCLRPKQMAKPQNRPALFNCLALSVTPAVYHTVILKWELFTVTRLRKYTQKMQKTFK